MSVDLNLITNSDAFKLFVQNRRQEIREQLKAYEALLQEDAELEKLEVMSFEGQVGRNLNYNKKWTWVEKITFVLGTTEMTGNQIVNAIAEIEPYLEYKSVYNSVLATLSVHSKDGKVFKAIDDSVANERRYSVREDDLSDVL